jgi:hypothetical protein
MQTFAGVSEGYVSRFEVSGSARFVVVNEPDARNKIEADGDLWNRRLCVS